MGSDNLFYKNKIRKEKELARQKAKRAPYAIMHIVCEDTKSAPLYFKRLRQHYRLNNANIVVSPSKGSAPINVVDSAINIAKSTPDIDIMACVFDRDSHTSYHNAVDKIKKHKPNKKDKSTPEYNVFTANPCFELWLLLHFQYSTKPYNRAGKKSAADILISDLKKYLSNYDKYHDRWFKVVIKELNTAVENAKKLQNHNKKTGSDNPSTNLHELIEIFMKLNT